MSDTAAHLVDRVFPIVPVRQWVLSLPFALRYRMAYDARLTTDVLNVFIRALFGELRRRSGIAESRLFAMWRRHVCAALWRRLNANVHFHCLVIDGVYAVGEDGRPEFHHLPGPEDEDVLRLATIVSQKIQSLLEGRCLTDADSQQTDPLSKDDPGMAALLANSVRHRIAVGSNAGHGVVRLGDQIDGDSMDAFQSSRCAMVSGFSVHANVCVEARDRMRLERLCRYAGRPAVATERLTALPDGRLLYRLKRPWRG
jgi:Putative transposase